MVLTETLKIVPISGYCKPDDLPDSPVAIELYSELTGFVQIFAGFTAEGSTNRNGAVKGGDFSLNSA